MQIHIRIAQPLLYESSSVEAEITVEKLYRFTKFLVLKHHICIGTKNSAQSCQTYKQN
jgi:hypothetical protein